MSTFSTRSASREAPRVGDYRRGSRVRTTRAGTWFPAVGPDEQPAGLLLLHPAVKLGPLRATLSALADLGLPGVLPALPDLVDQAGRMWLVSTASPAPTLADLLEADLLEADLLEGGPLVDGPHRRPANAAALLADVAGTLLAAHRAGLAHGTLGPQAVVLGPDGSALLADWGVLEHPGPAADVTGWAELAGLLRGHWASGPGGEPLPEAVEAAAHPDPGTGLVAALERLRGPAAGARRDELAEAATRQRPARRPPRRALPPLPPELAEDPEPTCAPGPEPTPDPFPASDPVADPAPDPAGAGPDLAGSGPADGPGRARRGRALLLALSVVALLVAAAGLLAHALDGGRERGTAMPGGTARTAPTTAPAGPPPAVPPPTPPSARAPGQPSPGAPLEIRDARVSTQFTGAACVALAAFTTNGQPGRVIFRWYGQSDTLPVGTVSAPPRGQQVEVGLVWTPGNSPLPGPVVSVQLLDPRSTVSSGPVPPECD